MFTTLGYKVINLDPSSMCKLLGVHDKGDEVFDSNNWPILDNFNPKKPSNDYANQTP